MSKKNVRTSVDLTEFVQPIKERLTPIYGLKGILSAGILVFSKLSAEGREKAIAEANGLQVKSEPAGRKTLRDAIETVKELTRQESRPGIKIISKEEQAELAELRKALGPEPSKRKKAKRG